MVRGMSIVALESLFRREYHNAMGEYSNTNAWDAVGSLASEIPSLGPSETYRMLQELPEFQQWIGDLKKDDLAEYSYVLENQDFAAAVDVHKNEIDDDRDGIILSRIRGMAGGETRKWGKLVDAAIKLGTTALGLDSIAFYSDATGARLNDNLLAGTISAGTPTLAQIAADLRTVRNAGLGFKDTRGEIVGIMFDTFVVPPNLEMGFMQLLNSNSDPSLTNAGTVNPYKAWVKRVIVDPGLTDLNDFYAFATTYSVGGIIKQRRQSVETWLDASQLRVNKKLTFGGDFRGAVGYGLPILSAKVVSATS